MTKFQIELSRTQRLDVGIFGGDRDQAVRLVREANPGFQLEAVTELGEGDAIVREHLVLASCGVCGGVIWEGDRYGNGGEDCGEVCARCLKGGAGDALDRLVREAQSSSIRAQANIDGDAAGVKEALAGPGPAGQPADAELIGYCHRDGTRFMPRAVFEAWSKLAAKPGEAAEWRPVTWSK